MHIAINVEAKSRGNLYIVHRFEYKVIQQFLSKFHNIEMSMSTLKRRLKEFGLQRKRHEAINMNEVTEIIRRKLNGPGVCLVTEQCGIRYV